MDRSGCYGSVCVTLWVVGELIIVCVAFADFYGQVADSERAGFSASDEQKVGGVPAQGRWGEDGVALLALATKEASWKQLKWGFGTWPYIPCHQWKGVTIADTGQGVVKLELSESNLTGECPPTRVAVTGWTMSCYPSLHWIQVQCCNINIAIRVLCRANPLRVGSVDETDGVAAAKKPTHRFERMSPKTPWYTSLP